MTSTHTMLHSFLATRGGDLVEDFVITAILVIVVLAVTRLPRIAAKTRHALLLVALAKLVVPVWAITAALDALGAEMPGALRAVGEATTAGTIWIGFSSKPATSVSHGACILAALWIAVAMMLIALQISAHMRVRGVARRAKPAPVAASRILEHVRVRTGCRTAVGLAVSDEVGTPCVVRRSGNQVLLPALVDYAPEELEAVFSHELGHIRRRDLAIRAIAGIVVAIHWANPFAWLVRRRLHVEAESACDVEAIAFTNSIDVYLETIRKSILPGRREHAVAGMMSSGLAERLRRMPMFAVGYKSWNHALTLAVCTALMGAVTLAAAVPPAEQQEAPPSAPAADGAILSVVSTYIGHYGIFANVREVRPGQMQINVVVKDKETGSIVSAPRIITEPNMPAMIRSGTTTPDGLENEMSASVLVNALGEGRLDLEWTEAGVLVEEGSVEFRTGSERAESYDMFRKPIDLVLKDAKLADVLRMFAQLTGFEIQAPVDLDAKVTVELHGVPIEDAIDEVLDRTGAGWYVEGRTIVIAKMR